MPKQNLKLVSMLDDIDSVLPATVAARALIAQLWVAGLNAGYDGSGGNRPGARSSARKLWLHWDSMIPLPNKVTAPYWVALCESTLPGTPFNGFVMPTHAIFPHLDVLDCGLDSHLRGQFMGKMHGRSIRTHLSQNDRRRMHDSVTKEGALIGLPNGEFTDRVPIRKLEVCRNVNDDRKLQAAIDYRLERFIELANPPHLPTCPVRLGSCVPGMHIKQIAHDGIAVRGRAANVPISWTAEGNALMVYGQQRTQIPVVSNASWFGFTMRDDAESLYAWGDAYRGHREEALETLRINAPVSSTEMIRSVQDVIRDEVEASGRLMELNALTGKVETKRKPRDRGSDRAARIAELMGMRLPIE